MNTFRLLGRAILSTLVLIAPAGLLAQGAPIQGIGAYRPTASQSGPVLRILLVIDLTGVTGRAGDGTRTAVVLAGHDSWIGFDPAHVRLANVEPGTSPGYTTPPVFTNIADANDQGMVSIVAVQLDKTGPTGAVHVATAVFNVVDAEPTSIVAGADSLSSAATGGGPTLIYATPAIGENTPEGWTESTWNTCSLLRPASIPPATAHVPYSAAFEMPEAVPPVRFSTTSVLPAGLSLSSDGVLAGTPDRPGSYSFAVWAEDAEQKHSFGRYIIVIGCPADAGRIAPTTIPDATLLAGYEVSFSVSGGFGPPYSFSSQSDLPLGMQLSSTGTLSGTPLVPGTYPLTVIATGGGCSTWRLYVLTVALPLRPAPPANLVARALSTSQVAVTWDASPDAIYYEVARLGPGGTHIVGDKVAAISFMDLTVSPSTAYVYAVRAVGLLGPSAFSRFDPTVTVAFSDDPISRGVTVVSAGHVTELRSAVTALRATAGLPSASWTESTLLPRTTVISGVHITQLRNAISSAYAALGMTAPAFTGGNRDGQTILAIHIEELRAALE